MRKTYFIALAATLLLAACGRKSAQNPAADSDDIGTAPGVPATQLDVESLCEPFDLDMDISHLALSDLRILRNAFAARVGYPFRDAYLRSIYGATTWYDELMYEFDGAQENFLWTENDDDNGEWRDAYYRSIKPSAVPYTEAELAFIERVKRREAELMAQNFEVPKGYRVNTMNIVNPAQLTTFDPMLAARLARLGFAIVPARHEQLFHVYEQNDYHEFPSFITTDVYLQLYHLYFDCITREVEQERLLPLLTGLCRDMYYTTNEQATKSGSEALRQAARRNRLFFAVAYQLMTDQQLPLGEDQQLAQAEVQKVMAAQNDFSDYIAEYSAADGVQFAYSLFRPRGHYTRTEKLQRYFRAMMWLQGVPMGLDAPGQLAQAVQMADALRTHQPSRAALETTDRLLAHLMGPADNLSVLQVLAELQRTGLTAQQLLASDTQMEQMRQRLNGMAQQQTRIRPRHAKTSRGKVCLLPQRYQPDAEVLQEMVDYDGDPTQRATPRGLDVMAAMGSSAAEHILLDELHEAQQWQGFAPTLQRMKARMDSVDWTATTATRWLQVAKTVTDTPDQAPYFMLSAAWDKKALNTALSAWAELKHDAILYAKQPMGAECGAGGPPEPVVKGYVEPNVVFWRKVVDLITATQKVLNDGGAMTERAATVGQHMKEEAEFLLRLSEKELRGETLKEQEYDQLEYFGATVENMTLELLRDSEHELWEWEAVQGPDRKVALVADVYTANADNNPNHVILYEGIGAADEIYVVVEIGGCLYLTRGAVFSYREFTRPADEQRMNDEEWQQRLENDPRQGVPTWMAPIIVPLEETPVDNEEVFYSSGC